MVLIKCNQGKGTQVPKFNVETGNDVSNCMQRCSEVATHNQSKTKEENVSEWIYYGSIKATIQNYKTTFLLLIHAIMHVYLSPITTSLFVVIEVMFVFSSINRWLSFTIQFDMKGVIEICKIIALSVLILFGSVKILHFFSKKHNVVVSNIAASIAKLTTDEILLVFLPAMYVMAFLNYMFNMTSSICKYCHHFSLFLLFAVTW